MTHIVVGYPTLRESERIASVLARNSEIVELQIPFSDPSADGPTIATANEISRKNGITAKKCLEFAGKISRKFPQTEFLLMTYFNPVLQFGIEKFVKKAKSLGIRGFIVPDLPIEESTEFLAACKKNKLNFIFVVAPNSTKVRLRKITAKASSFIYCAARLGVTGQQTSFDSRLKKFLTRVKKFTQLPLAVGFGVNNRKDIMAIKKSGGEIAVIGSAIIGAYKIGGIKAVEQFMKNLH